MKTANYRRGSKMAMIWPHNGRFAAWVGYDAGGGGTIPARWFKRCSTCSAEYKTAAGAQRAVAGFLKVDVAALGDYEEGVVSNV